jgi:hypothetical protein
MVDIVKRGTLYQDRVFEVQCRNCVSLLRFTGAEVIEGAAVKYVVCPVCEIWVNAIHAQDVAFPLSPLYAAYPPSKP